MKMIRISSKGLFLITLLILFSSCNKLNEESDREIEDQISKIIKNIRK